MKRVFISVVIIVLCLFGNYAGAGVSLVMNGSFEKDGYINDVSQVSPWYWCDVNIPTGKFDGHVVSGWSTHADYSLLLHSKAVTKCDSGDVAVVSQQLNLQDVNDIIFDLKLSTSSTSALWDPAKRSALILIDDNIIWDSDSWTPNAGGEYLNQTVDVNDIYKDANSHTLSVAIRCDVDETSYPYIEYRTHWDFIKFDSHCGGFGCLPEDFDRDCYVDYLDLAGMAGEWLSSQPSWQYDLIEDGLIDGFDFGVFASSWRYNSDWRNYGQEGCFEMGLLDADVNSDGVVNLKDFAVVAGDWQEPVRCSPSDIDRSGLVDGLDISLVADGWLATDWIFGLD